jgi:signal peptidase
MEIVTRPSGTRRSIGRRLVNLGCLLVMLLALLFIIPALFGMQRYVIVGGSMSGTFEVGSVAFEKVVPVEDLAVGDVITYQPPAESGIETLVSHRIVSIHGDTFRTKGDANKDVDPWTFQLTADNQPRVAFTVPLVGYLFIALADQSTRLVLIGLPAGVIAIFSLVELVGALRKPATAEANAPAARDHVATGV